MERVMPQTSRYAAGSLIAHIEALRQQQFSGVAYLNPDISTGQPYQSYIATFSCGQLAYFGHTLPSPREFVQLLCQRLNPKLASVAIKYVLEHSSQLPLGAILDQLVRVRIFSWAQVEAFLQEQAIQLLDCIQELPGQMKADTTQPFSLAHHQEQVELSWTDICVSLEQRSQIWRSLAPQIPSKHAVPVLLSQPFPPIIASAAPPLNDVYLQQQVGQVTDGRRSLLEIADVLQRDPLEVARFYAGLVANGVVHFASVTVQPAITQKVRPTVLTVDDSPIVQVMLKRALADHCRVLTAGNGAEALAQLKKETIQLAILDVTMPDVNGLELCRLIRQIPQYKELPILMLTARDGYADRLRGQIAGTTKYLIKPVEPEKLLEIVQSYLQPQLA